MALFSKNRIFSIGVDIGYDAIKLVQLGTSAKGISVIALDGRKKPENIRAGTADWQRWAIEVLAEITSNGQFHGKSVIASIPSNEVFIDHIKAPNTGKSEEYHKTVISNIEKKLPFEPENSLIKYLTTQEDNIVVLVTAREKIDRNLAIYERAGLKIKSIGAWPIAQAKTYAAFFGRRESDINTVVMLLEIEGSHSKLVICRCKEILFAHSIPIGLNFLDNAKPDEMAERLASEMTRCRSHFDLMYQQEKLERIILLSTTKTFDKLQDIYKAIASQMAMPTQIGDCLAAVEMDNVKSTCLDREDCDFSWATAFGLGLWEPIERSESGGKNAYLNAIHGIAKWQSKLTIKSGGLKNG